MMRPRRDNAGPRRIFPCPFPPEMRLGSRTATHWTTVQSISAFHHR